jgi:hypothetical protein
VLIAGLTGASRHVGLTAAVPAPGLASAITALASGLLGLGRLAALARRLSAVGAAGWAAAWAVAGSAVGSGAAAVTVAVRIDTDPVTALSVAPSVGPTAPGAGLLSKVWRRRGALALAGCGLTVLGGGLGRVAAAAAPALGPVVGLAAVGPVVAVGEGTVGWSRR